MEIDARLIKFKTDVSPYINGMMKESKSLIEKLNNFSTITENATSALDSSFSTEGMGEIKSNISSLNLEVSEISNSIYNELDPMLEKCVKLSLGISDLEALQEEYNIIINSNNVDNNEAKVFERKFKDKEIELLQLYLEILSSDSKILNTDQENLSSNNKTSIYENDDAFYQESMPKFRGKKFKLKDKITIIYDKHKVIDSNKEAGTDLINHLKTSKTDSPLWDYKKNKYSNNDGIAKVMNQVLEDTYAANNCSKISDYASVAGMVVSGGPVSMKYASSDNAWNSPGFSSLLENGGSISGNDLINWSYSQGLSKTGNNISIDSSTISNICFDNSVSVSDTSYEDLCKLEKGSCIIKGDNHMGMVLGYTKVDDELCVVVAESIERRNSGASCNIYKVKSSFGNSNNKWHSYTSANVINNKLIGG